MKEIFKRKRRLSKDGSVHVTDEIINTQTHIIAAIFALLGFVILVVKSSIMGKVWHIVSFSIYGFSLFVLFLFSSMHHGINASKKTESLFRLFDYFAIYPLIAGTFTPLCLVLVRNWFGWSILGMIWSLAIIGLTIKAIFPLLPKWYSNTIYISMGWIGGILALPLLKVLDIYGLLLLLLGGVFYSIGFIIFIIEKPNPLPGKFGFHEIWHILVILGSLSFYLLMFFFVLPY